MNVKKIAVADNAAANYELFYIYGGIIVTGNGTIELSSTNNREWKAMSVIFHNRGGVLTIENGTFTNLGGTDMAWVVDNSGNHYGDATTNINAVPVHLLAQMATSNMKLSQKQSQLPMTVIPSLFLITSQSMQALSTPRR